MKKYEKNIKNKNNIFVKKCVLAHFMTHDFTHDSDDTRLLTHDTRHI
jgi:hypothetical protein